ncbi:MAG: hypothetical protein DCC65_00250 [Planctomycetota bacterium]|nr:MAG: hypothetical protein DCC65_00250 [Planctomycetota bacterium]
MTLHRLRPRTLVSLLIVFGILAASRRTEAFPPPVPLVITNPGFEANPVATNCFQGFIPSGWTLYDPNGIYDGAVDAVGGLNTQPGGPHFINGAPEGEHVALVFLQGDIGGGPMGLMQALSDVLETNTHYTLTVQVGNIASGQGPPPCDVFGFFDLDGFPGYQVQLLAGGMIIAQDNNSLADTIDEGEWGLVTIQISIGESHPQAGLPLEIRLINLNMIDSPVDPGFEVDFDDVRLQQGCPADGDIDADEDIDLDDAALFVDVLLELEMDPLYADRADMDCSGYADAADLRPLLTALVN